MNKFTRTTIDPPECSPHKDILIKLGASISSEAYAHYQRQLIQMRQLVIEAERCVKLAESICYSKKESNRKLKIFHGFGFLYW